MNEQGQPTVLVLAQAYERELGILETRVALFGIDVPPYLLNQIKDLRTAIVHIETEIVSLKTKLNAYDLGLPAIPDQFELLRERWLALPPQQQYLMWSTLTATEQQKLFTLLETSQQLVVLDSLSDEEKKELGIIRISDAKE